MTEEFRVTGTVEIFPQEGGWVHVGVPEAITEATAIHADRGLVAITVTLGDSTWDTSLLPKGDGTQFIPLKAKVCDAENIEIGDRVSLSFELRDRG